MHLFTSLRTKCALLLAGALIWGTQTYAGTIVEKWDFQAMAREKGAYTTFTRDSEYIPNGATADSQGQYPIGQSDWSYSSYYVQELGSSIALARIYGGWTYGFRLGYVNDTQCGLESSSSYTLTVVDLPVGAVVTVVGRSGVIKSANKYTYGGEWTEEETTNTETYTSTYVYTMTEAGDLNLLCSSNNDKTKFIYSLKIELPTPDVYAPTIAVVEGEDNTSKKIQVGCTTKNVTINCTIFYEDGTTESKSVARGETFRIYKTATSIKAQATLGSGDEQKISRTTTSLKIKAGEIDTPTAIVTKVDGVNRTVKFTSTEANAHYYYNTNGSKVYTLCDDEITISAKTTFYIKSEVIDVYDNTYTLTTTGKTTINAGTTVTLNGVTITADNADKVTFTADQSDVVAAPIANIAYTFTPINHITGFKGTPVTGSLLSGQSVTLGHGIITAYAYLDGYNNSETTTIEYKALELQTIEEVAASVPLSIYFPEHYGKELTKDLPASTSWFSYYTLDIKDETYYQFIGTEGLWTLNADGLYNQFSDSRYLAIKPSNYYVQVTLAPSSVGVDFEDEDGWAKRDRLHSTSSTIVYAPGATYTKVPSHTTIESIIFGKDISNSRTISYDAVTGYTTFYWDKPIAIPNDVIAYTGTLNDTKDVLTLSEISGGYIPACTPVILAADSKKGESEEVSAADVDIDAIESDLNGILIAQTANKYITEGNAYVLSRKEDASTLGFYKFSGETLAANKAYLVIPEASSAPVIRFNFGDGSEGNISGIEEIKTETLATSNIFDLQGRCLQQVPQKGLFILNGKKVIR